ncbi:MAG: hypothetical protein Fur002_21440 [Anaerolineales bacterium]
MKKILLALMALALLAPLASCQSNAPAPTSTAAPSSTSTQTKAPQTPKPPVFLPSPTPLRPAIATAIPAATDSFATQTPPPVETAALTSTAALRKRGLDAPIGDYYQFVIHKTQGAERLEDLAAQYNTTVEAILYINYNVTNPTWAAVLVVIPVNFSQVEGLPVFVAYRVTEEERGISASALAEKLRANPFDFMYYNGMQAENERPLVGDWVLVPWSRPVGRVRLPTLSPEEEKKK